VTAPVGVLALQGDFPTHRERLEQRGIEVREVRVAADLQGLSGLVLPGGESTTMLRLLEAEGLYDPLLATIREDLPVLATCAGLILLAETVTRPVQRSLAVLRVAVERNSYGRQLASGIHPLRGSGGFPDCRGAFIRAPRITRVGAGVEVLASRDGDPVLVRQGPILASTFHPEMDAGHPAHELWVRSLGGVVASGLRTR
jgi:5'-phosphate synthase pdxT subunit